MHTEDAAPAPLSPIPESLREEISATRARVSFLIAMAIGQTIGIFALAVFVWHSANLVQQQQIDFSERISKANGRIDMLEMKLQTHETIHASGVTK